MPTSKGSTKRWYLRGLIMLHYGTIGRFAQATGIRPFDVSSVVCVRFAPDQHDIRIWEDALGKPWSQLCLAETHDDYVERMAARRLPAPVEKEVA